MRRPAQAQIHKQPPIMRQASPARPLTIYIMQLADRVLAGEVVTADLNDGTLVALMEELARRGSFLVPRAEDDPDRKRYPFLLRVSRPQ